MATYPNTIANFLTLVDGVDSVVAAHSNDRAAEITAIETELGTNPKGGCADLKTRLAVAMDNNGYVKNTGLKTATGEVGNTGSNNYNLPGGEYGFYPQLKGDFSQAFFVGAIFNFGVYTTNIYLNANNGIVYAQQRYVTASGEDMWIFLLLDKTTKEIIGAYQAPDHPAYGNGGDFDKLPHPFSSYDPNTQEIVLLDKDTCNALKQESKQTGRSILTLVNEEYKPNMDKEEIYQPLHSGKFLTKDNMQVKQMVESIPDYITVRSLIKLTDEEKLAKEIIRQQIIEKTRKGKEREDLIQAKIREQAISALQSEGKLTDMLP